jgi:signal transduction histidine kinase
VTDTGARTLDEALATLAACQARSDALFEASGAVQLLVDLETGEIVRANGAAERFYGWPVAAMSSMLITDLDGTSLDEWGELASSGALHRGDPVRRTHRVSRGGPRETQLFPVCITLGQRDVVHLIVQDVADGARAEAGLREMERRLHDLQQRAGATGHDFNNVLTVLRGSTAFLQDAIAPDSPSQEDIAALERATDRAEELLRALVELVRRG